MHFCSFVHQVILREAWSQNVFFCLKSLQHATPNKWRYSRNFSDFWTRDNDSDNIIPLLTEASLPNITNISLSKSIYRNRTIVRKRSFLMISVFWSIWKCMYMHDLDNVFWLVCHLMYLAISHGIACGTKITLGQMAKSKKLEVGKSCNCKILNL